MKIVLLILITLFSLSASDTLSIDRDSVKIALTDEINRELSLLRDYPQIGAIDLLPLNFSARSLRRSSQPDKNFFFHSKPEILSIHYGPIHPLNTITASPFPLFLRDGTLSGIYNPGIPLIDELISYETLSFSPTGVVESRDIVSNRTVPHLFFATESGPFDGTSFDFSIVRNLSRDLSFGFYSSFREMERAYFTHKAGGVENLYRSLPLDTNRLSLEGVHPHSSSKSTGAQLNWSGNSSHNLRFNYSDRSFDIVTPTEGFRHKDDTLWFRESLYHFSFKERSEIPLSRFTLSPQISIENLSSRVRPVSTSDLPSTIRHRGEKSYIGLSTQIGYKTFNNRHHPSLTYTFEKHSVEPYYAEKGDIKEQRIIIGDSLALKPTTLNYSAGLAIYGDTVLKQEALYLGELKINLPQARFSLWSTRDLLPLYTPFSELNHLQLTADEFIDNPEFITEAYIKSGAGATLFLTDSLLAIGLKWQNISNVSESERYWYNGLSPFKTSSNSWTISPTFGEVGGFSIQSAFTITDMKPHFKAQSNIQYRINPRGFSRHVYFNLNGTYWSQRDPITYLERDDWHYEIIDLGLSITSEIKQFRLTYSMDNLLNRSNSYIPGYEMPGLIFRWGFIWTILG